MSAERLPEKGAPGRNWLRRLLNLPPKGRAGVTVNSVYGGLHNYRAAINPPASPSPEEGR